MTTTLDYRMQYCKVQLPDLYVAIHPFQHPPKVSKCASRRTCGRRSYGSVISRPQWERERGNREDVGDVEDEQAGGSAQHTKFRQLSPDH